MLESTFKTAVESISLWAIPLVFITIVTAGYLRGVKVYEVFVDGAKEGFEIAIRIIPFLVAILAAVGMFRESGGMDLLVRLVSPATDAVGYPAEVLPMAFMRPLSGGGSLGLMTDLINTHGADSFIGRLSSTLMGSTETTFYIAAVYFGSVAVRRQRHTIPACLIADLVGVIAAFIVCKIAF